MTEQRSPGDEPIIELTDVVDPSAADEEEIIELTDVVDAPPSADEEIIELTDIVKAPPAEAEIIELVDVVDAPGAGEVAAAESASEASPAAEAKPPAEAAPETSPPAEAEEPVEDAFNLFDDPAADADTEAAGADDDLDFAPMDLDIEEDKADGLFDSLGMKLEPELQTGGEADELDFNLSTQELSDAIDLLDAKLAEEPPTAAPGGTGQEAALPASISEAQLEKALENVIRKMFAEKIDVLLNEAIEKSVTAEIEHLKNQLLQDAPED